MFQALTSSTRVLGVALVVGLTVGSASSASADWRLPHGVPRRAHVAVSVHAAAYTLPAPVLRWDPCAAVPWSFNPAGAPPGGEDTVRVAVARVSIATRLRFIDVGASTVVPDSAGLASGVLLIGWTTPRASSLLAGQPANTTGVSQGISVASAIIGEVIALNADLVAPMTGASSWYTFALHELGHAVGLMHTTDATQIMNATIPPVVDFGAGDLAGLAAVGGTCQGSASSALFRVAVSAA